MYQHAKIYKIEADGTDPYVGSTAQLLLCSRFAGHKRQHKHKLKTGKGGMTTSHSVLEKPNCRITLIENYPCNSKDELVARERWWINEIDCVNKVRPVITLAEREEYMKTYYQQNKETIKQQAQKYYAENKDEINYYRSKGFKELDI